MDKKVLMAITIFALVITTLTIIPVNGSVSSPPASEVSPSTTHEWHLVDSWTGTINATSLPSSKIAQAAAQITQAAVEEAVKTPQKKVTSYGPIFWQGDPLIKSPEWSWIPAGIVGILGIIIIGQRRLFCAYLKYVLSSFSMCLMTF